jgi:energy-coupling factor transporter ATP-binding protein EcfA2
MDIKTFKTIATKLPPEIAVLMRGPTGVGKSHLAKAAAEALELPYIDVRGSTMSEGDAGGYPDIEGMKKNGIMTFCMPSWFIRGCREPVVIMLDELNRSLPGVQQSFFQLVLDRELGNDEDGVPYRLHPGTRVFAAVNHGAEYDVNDMDPALLRRFWVVDLQPTHEDFISWAGETGLDSVLIDFIRQNPAHLRVDPSKVEAGTVCPNPASWHRLDRSLAHMGLSPSSLAGNKAPLLYPLSQGFIGTEAAIAFSEFVSKYETVLSAEDVLDRFAEVQDRVKAAPASSLTALIDKLADHCKKNKWSKEQVKNVNGFSLCLTGELLVQLWNSVSASGNLPNIQGLHAHLGKRIVEAVKSSREVK